MPAKGQIGPRKMCVNHPDKRAHGHGMCSNCYAKWHRNANPKWGEELRNRVRAYRTVEENRARSKQRISEYYHANRPILLDKAKQRWHKLSEHDKWEKNLKSTYGITSEDYYKMLESQGGCCAVCQGPPDQNIKYGRGKFRVDHDHSNGNVRGLLCAKCNLLLGVIDNTEGKILQRAIQYASTEPGAKKNDGYSGTRAG